MAATAAETASTEQPRRGRPRKQTTLDSHLDKPSVVEPGDPPFADTMDPYQRATSVEPDKAAAAAGGFQTVNAVVPLPEPERVAEAEREHRTEKYQAVKPNGKLGSYERDIETGETREV